MLKRAMSIIFLAAFFGGIASAAAESLKVGLHLPDRRPYFGIDEQQKQQGLYIDLLQRIGQIVGVEMEFVYWPQARLIKEFEEGKLDIEPGIAAAWRPSPEAQKISLYSSPFINLDDVLIFPVGKAIAGITTMADLTKLKGLNVGQVRGFYVPEGLKVIEARDELQIAKMTDKGNLDAGFMNALVAAYYQKTLGLQYEISAPFASTPVSLRLHRNQEKWLKPINAAIEQLQRDGTLQQMMATYIK